MNKIVNFFRGVKSELGKIVWPTRKEATRYTVQVIIFSLGMAIILGAADIGLVRLLEFAINK